MCAASGQAADDRRAMGGDHKIDLLQPPLLPLRGCVLRRVRLAWRGVAVSISRASPSER